MGWPDGCGLVGQLAVLFADQHHLEFEELLPLYGAAGAEHGVASRRHPVFLDRTLLRLVFPAPGQPRDLLHLRRRLARQRSQPWRTERHTTHSRERIVTDHRCAKHTPEPDLCRSRGYTKCNQTRGLMNE